MGSGKQWLNQIRSWEWIKPFVRGLLLGFSAKESSLKIVLGVEKKEKEEDENRPIVLCHIPLIDGLDVISLYTKQDPLKFSMSIESIFSDVILKYVNFLW